MSVRLSGPSLAALGKPFDIHELPASPFDVETKIRSVADGIEFDDTRVLVGEEQASGRGPSYGCRMAHESWTSAQITAICHRRFG